ncbi:MAG: hypothetical protein ACFFCI_01105, partial [Promethearchaeota archaeon]
KRNMEDIQKERSELTQKYKKLKKFHLIIGIIGIFLIMGFLISTTLFISLYRTEIQDTIDSLILLWGIILGIILFSMFFPIFIIESKEETLLKKINALTITIRKDMMNRFETLKNRINNNNNNNEV